MIVIRTDEKTVLNDMRIFIESIKIKYIVYIYKNYSYSLCHGKEYIIHIPGRNRQSIKVFNDLCNKIKQLTCGRRKYVKF